MQHTDKYHFNIIETSDTFSPEALNENARAAEKELAAVRDEFAAGDAALEGKLSNHETRIASMEVHRIAMGSYAGTGVNVGDVQTIDVGFTPVVVYINNRACDISTTSTSALAFTGSPALDTLGTVVLEIVENGFRALYGRRAYMNHNGLEYCYIAFC